VIHIFSDFRQFFGEKIGVFQKIIVFEPIFASAVFGGYRRQFFAKFLSENILKITTLVPSLINDQKSGSNIDVNFLIGPASSRRHFFQTIGAPKCNVMKSRL
jgi:hypothetical protein